MKPIDGGTLGAWNGGNVYAAVSDVRMSSVSLGTPGAQPFAFDSKIALLYDNKVGGGLSAPKLETGGGPHIPVATMSRDAAPRNPLG